MAAYNGQEINTEGTETPYYTESLTRLLNMVRALKPGESLVINREDE